MASKTPKRQATSPSKQRSMKLEQQTQDDYVLLDKDLVRGLSEKEVEIEHLRTQLVAFEEKIVVKFCFP